MKNLWNRRSKKLLLAVCFLFTVLPICCAKDESGFSEDIPVHNIDRGKSTPPAENKAHGQSSSPSLSSRSHTPHSRQRRQMFDGFRFSDMFRIFNQGALEGVDSVLRSTRNFDVFQCLERISCEMAAPLRDNGNSDHEAVIGQDDVVEDVGHGGGFQTVQVPFVQTGFPAGQFVQVPTGTQFIQPVQVPFQQFPAQTGFQQVVQPATQFAHPQSQFAQIPQQQFAQSSVQHFVQQPFQGHAQAFRQGSHPTQQHFDVGRNPPAETHIKRSDEAPPEHQERENAPSFFGGYRNMVRRARERSPWFNRFLNPFNVRGKRRRRRSLTNEKTKSKKLSRRKRGIMDTIQRMWGGKEFVGVLDRMMEGTDDSLYPYTRAALMGYTGSTSTCEQLYPECPTNMDEVIDTFNNLRSYFPNGVPFRDRIPIPLRYLIP